MYGDNFCFEQIIPTHESYGLLSGRYMYISSDNTRICYGKNNGFTTNDWREKHIFVYLVDFVQLQILQFLQGHRKKIIINFVNFIAELTILDISVGKFCQRHLIQDCSVRDKNCELLTNLIHIIISVAGDDRKFVLKIRPL